MTPKTLCPSCREEGSCQHPGLCPLTRVQAGSTVRIRRLMAPEAVMQRLREIGLCENRVIRLLASQANLICQVCGSRLGISVQLGEAILVEPATGMAVA